MLDVRSSAEYANGHIEGSLNIGLGGQFASWAGTMIPLHTAIIIVADAPVQIDEAVLRLARVGIESVIGYLRDGLKTWTDAGFKCVQANMLSASQLKQLFDAGDDLFVLDVRRSGEFISGHVPKAVNIPLAELSSKISQLPKDRALTIICASGYRSSIANGILERAGFKSTRLVSGGTLAWKDAAYAMMASV